MIESLEKSRGYPKDLRVKHLSLTGSMILRSRVRIMCPTCHLSSLGLRTTRGISRLCFADGVEVRHSEMDVDTAPQCFVVLRQLPPGCS